MKIKSKIRHLVVLLYLLFGRSRKNEMQGLTRVLVFHHLDKPDLFEKIVILFKRRYNILSFQDFLDGKKSLDKMNIIISFDDGYKSWFNNGFKIFKRHEIKPIYFINSDFIDCKNDAARKYCTQYIKTWSEDSLEWSDVNSLLSIGGEIGSHTICHTDLSCDSLNNNDKFSRVMNDKILIERILSKSVRAFSYPFGRWGNSATKVVQSAGFKYAFTSDSGFLEE